MKSIMLARTAHILAFTRVARRIGTPVERELVRAGLPCLLENRPDAYIPVRQALRFIQNVERKEGIDDLGCLAAREEGFTHLSGQFTGLLCSTSTLFELLCNFGRLAHLENTHCRVSLTHDGDMIRVANNLAGAEDLIGLRYSEWIQVIVLIEIIREALGLTTWRPMEIGFRSRFTSCEEAFEEFPNTRFLFGQEDTSIRVPASLMSQSLHGPGSGKERQKTPAETREPPVYGSLDFPGSLKVALRTYLPAGYPDVRVAAEIAGASVRTLQRQLARFGLSYLRLIQQVRFEAASEMLRNPSVRILDVARAIGYEDQSHFTRAFRRVAGVSPTAYRVQVNTEAGGSQQTVKR